VGESRPEPPGLRYGEGPGGLVFQLARPCPVSAVA